MSISEWVHFTCDLFIPTFSFSPTRHCTSPSTRFTAATSFSTELNKTRWKFNFSEITEICFSFIWMVHRIEQVESCLQTWYNEPNVSLLPYRHTWVSSELKPKYRIKLANWSGVTFSLQFWQINTSRTLLVTSDRWYTEKQIAAVNYRWKRENVHPFCIILKVIEGL
jgi:hypothetical protein